MLSLSFSVNFGRDLIFTGNDGYHSHQMKHAFLSWQSKKNWEGHNIAQQFATGMNLVNFELNSAFHTGNKCTSLQRNTPRPKCRNKNDCIAKNGDSSSQLGGFCLLDLKTQQIRAISQGTTNTI